MVTVGRNGPGRENTAHEGHTLAVPIGFPAFSLGWIGEKRYMSASVTVAQCFRRLEARGLVDRLPGYGINLAKAGSEVAKNML